MEQLVCRSDTCQHLTLYSAAIASKMLWLSAASHEVVWISIPLFPPADRRMSKRVFISNVFPDGNKGGAAITSATIQAVQKGIPDAEVTLITVQVNCDDRLEETHRFTAARHLDVGFVKPIIPEIRGPFAGLRTVLLSLLMVVREPRHSSNLLVREIANADLVVSKGGYVFVERSTIRKALRVWTTAFPLVIAFRAGVRTAAIGASIGPFDTWHSRVLNRWILRRLDLLVPRDEYSHQEALALGVRAERIAMFPDVVFSHPGSIPSISSEMLERHALVGVRYAAVSLAVGEKNNEFLPRLKSMLLKLLDGGQVDQIKIVLQSQQDLALSRAFVEDVSDRRITLIDSDLSPDQLIGLYGAARLVIARRMHTAIFAIVAGTPTFACTKYGMKVQGVMRSLRLEQYLVNYPDFDAEDVLSRIRAALADESTTRNQVREAAGRARIHLQALPEYLARAAAGAPLPVRDEDSLLH